ncbi:hypothetical protein [Phormidesmis sp. 146-33]
MLNFPRDALAFRLFEYYRSVQICVNRNHKHTDKRTFSHQSGAV